MSRTTSPPRQIVMSPGKFRCESEHPGASDGNQVTGPAGCDDPAGPKVGIGVYMGNIRAAHIIATLKGNEHSLMCLCPAHDDHNPSLFGKRYPLGPKTVRFLGRELNEHLLGAAD